MRERDLMTQRRFWCLVAGAMIALTAVGAPFARAKEPVPAPSGLDVQPFPGTPDASPRTEIGFPALAPAQIRELTVTGSRSGPHRGRLTALPAGHGAAFVPARPFTDGERVTVRATLGSPAAGTAAGAPGATRISFRFRVTAPVRLSGGPSRSSPGDPPRAHAALSADELTHSFYSENWLHPPVVSVSGTEPDPGAGDIFADAESSIQPGPLIFNPQGQLIYFQPLRRSAAFNVQVQTYQGQSVLTYWQGYVENGVGIGRDVILNHSYQRIATVYAGDGYSADLHEFQITPQGDGLITAYAEVKADLSSVGGPRHGTLLDSIIQEVDIATGQVLWEWHASGHVSLHASYAEPVAGHPYDFFHINSIQQLPNGNLLISSRQTWALYEISMKTGRIVLEIGGKHSNFRFGPGASFEWQHDARMASDGTITVFDNAYDGATQSERQSRALRLRLDYRHRRVTLVRAYTADPPQLSSSQGDVEPLPDGNAFVAWGELPYFTEFGPTGRELFSMHFHWPLASYRGLRFQWWGQPTTPPSIAAAATTNGTTVYASWNGATTVASWRVLTGPAATALSAVGQFPKTFFETTMSVASTEPYFAVQALDAAGNVLGTSAVISR